MNTPGSETVRMKLSEIRERCRELLEEQEAAPELQLEDTDDADRGNDPYNRLTERRAMEPLLVRRRWRPVPERSRGGMASSGLDGRQETGKTEAGKTRTRQRVTPRRRIKRLR